MKIRAVHQVVAALLPGDAVGNEALEFRRMLRASAHESRIYAGHVAPEMADEGLPFDAYAGLPDSADAVTLLHFAIGSPVMRAVLARRGPLVLRYHNVTPAQFFVGYRPDLVELCHQGRALLAEFASRAMVGLAVSEFNRRDLVDASFEKTEVLPLAMNFTALEHAPDPFVLSRFNDTRRNLIFVGRLAPSKKVEDVIRVFCAYQRYVEPESRLFIVGDGRGFETYTRRLDELVSHLRIDEVVFTGPVTQAELNAYYRLSHAYLSLSEHEGYGAPLVEAMQFGLPVLAFDAGAVRETLRGGGVLMKDKAPEVVAELLDVVLNDEATRAAVLATQARALESIRGVDLASGLARILKSVGEAA
jgi:glycosyltransferase involved in cell wall biosynthesis